MAISEEKGQGLLHRVWNKLVVLGNTMDYSPYDYALDRIGALEREVAVLKQEFEEIRSDRPAPNSAPDAAHDG